MKDSIALRLLTIRWTKICSILIFLLSIKSYSQSIHISLSPSHLQKIEEAKSVRAKLKLYRKFYVKDSARFTKKVQTVGARKSDSVFLATKIIIGASDNKWVAKAGEVPSKIKKRDYNSLVDKYGSAEAKEIRKEYKRYTADLKKYEQKFGKFKNLDSLKRFALEDGKTLAERELKERLTPLVNQGELNQYRKEFDDLKRRQTQYTNQLKHLGDSAYLRQQAKEKAEQIALEYIQNNPLVLKAAQAKMSALMKVYSYVPNSNDLSTAIKRTSLKGKTFRQRLVLAGNFQMVAIKPITFDLMPMAGYKFNTRFVIGVGGSYRAAFKDSIHVLVSKSIGYKAFSSYDVIGNFFLYTEFNRNTIGRMVNETGSHLIWKNSWLIGAGKKISITPKLDMTMIAAYNFFYKPGDPLYPRPLVVRVGFQSSDVALLRRK